MNVRELRIEFDCATIVFEGFIASSDLGQEIAKFVFCLNERRVQFQHRKIASFCSFFLSQSNLRFGQFEIGFRLLLPLVWSSSLFQHFHTQLQVRHFLDLSDSQGRLAAAAPSKPVLG